jgi:hypothetical protein
MTTDFRELCARMADELQEYINYAPVGPCDEEQALVDEARAALAEPQPADQDLDDLVEEHLCLDVGSRREYARAVLARWGTSNLTETRSLLEPIPVSERLPEAGDCDAEGRCWFNAYYHNWLLEDKTYGSNAARSHWLPARNRQ